MIKLVVFDMDGTLADTSEGIINSHRYAHQIMGKPIPNEEDLRAVIGGQLLKTYQDRFAFGEHDARLAVAHYRDYYRREGIYQAQLYPGIRELLHDLSDMKLYLAVATLKAEVFAKDMLKRMGVLDLFSVVRGMDKDDTLTKEQLIKDCMESLHIGKDDTVLVGDSIHDLQGARNAGVNFIGVDYGFGFSHSKTYTDFPVCHSTGDILLQIKKL